MTDRSVVLAWLLVLFAFLLVAGSFGMAWVGMVGYPDLAWSVLFVILLAAGGVLVLRAAVEETGRGHVDEGQHPTRDS